jgi:small subunit ribosomal protein S3
MGQKTNPNGFRLGITRDWDSRWFAKGREFARYIVEDETIRNYIKKRLYHAGIAKIEIERQTQDVVRVRVHAARPGVAIGRKGAEIEGIREELQHRLQKTIELDIREVDRPETNAQLIAESVASQIERRVGFRRAMKKAISNALKFGVKGIKVSVAGRLGGAELARTEWYRVGRLPLQTLRANVDYGYAVAWTKYGVIGVKAWVFHGEEYGVRFLKRGVLTSGDVRGT